MKYWYQNIFKIFQSQERMISEFEKKNNKSYKLKSRRRYSPREEVGC